MATITLQRLQHAGITQARSIIGDSTGTIYQQDAVGRVTVAVADAGALLAQGYAVYTMGAGGGTAPSSGVAVIDFGVLPGLAQCNHDCRRWSRSRSKCRH